MSNPNATIKSWGYYEFGILSVKDAGQTAEVYVGVACGPLCGHGTLCTLQRNAAGQWEITDSTGLWIS